MESSKVKEKEYVFKLHQKFMILQQDWDSFKKSNPRNYSHSSNIEKTLKLEDNSPRELMSSLQRRSSTSTPEGVWKIRTNELAVEEILRDRKEALESGKLKGRRLFEETEETRLDWINVQESPDVIKSESFDYSDYGEKDSCGSKEIGVCFQANSCNCKCSSSSSSSVTKYVNNVKTEKENIVTVTQKKGIVYGWGGKRVLLWIITVVFVLIGIYITTSQEGFGDLENNITLVPT